MQTRENLGYCRLTTDPSNIQVCIFQTKKSTICVEQEKSLCAAIRVFEFSFVARRLQFSITAAAVPGPGPGSASGSGLGLAQWL